MTDPLTIWIEWFCAIVRCDSDRSSGEEGQALVALVARYRTSGLNEGLPAPTIAEAIYRAQALSDVVESTSPGALGLNESEHAEVTSGLHDMIVELELQGS